MKTAVGVSTNSAHNFVVRDLEMSARILLVRDDGCPTCPVVAKCEDPCKLVKCERLILTGVDKRGCGGTCKGLQSM